MTLLNSYPWEILIRRDIWSQAGGTNLHHSPGVEVIETIGLASKGAQLIDSGLSTKVVETILHSRAPDMSNLNIFYGLFSMDYPHKMVLKHQLDPVNLPVGKMLERFSTEFFAYNAHLSGKSLGRKPLVSHFLCGALTH